ncbi:MAG: signal peptidase II [Planctomycetota bacterium]|nr:signal peptidase II [Planctomycetota bacterium]
MKRSKTTLFGIFFSVAGLACIADQAAKFYLFSLPMEEIWRQELGPAAVGLEKALNTGAVFGLGQGMNMYFSLLSAAFLIAMVPFFLVYFLPTRGGVLSALAAGFAYGGVAGNFVDRLLFNHVRDFILLEWDGYIWPLFNIADACICAGVLYFAFRIAFEKDDKSKITSPVAEPA